MARSSSPLLAVLAAGLLLAGCTPKKSVFPGEGAVPAPAPAPPATAGSPADTQPLGAEGFRESALDASGGAGVGEMPPPDAAGAVAAALRTVYFDYDSDQLSDEAMRTLQANAAWLRSNPGIRVQVEGHADERGTVEYNLALGQRRARAVQDHLVRLGVPAAQLETISYGEERPAESGSGPETWAKNRRAEFRAAGE